MSDPLDALMANNGATQALAVASPGAKPADGLDALMASHGASVTQAASSTGKPTLTDDQVNALTDQQAMGFDFGKYDLSPEQRDSIVKRSMQTANLGTSSAQGLEDSRNSTGAISRGLVHGVASIPSLANDVVTWAQNLFRPANQQLPYTAQILDQALTKAGIPQATTPESRILQQAVEGGTAALTGAGAGGLVADASALPQVGGNVVKATGQMMASQPAQQVAAGAAGSAATQAVAEDNPDNPWLQTGAGLAASLAAGGATGIARRGAAAVRGEGAAIPQERMVADANAAGGKLMTSDVFPPKGPAGTLVQNILEKNPFWGTGGLRNAQQADRQAAVETLFKDYGAGDLTGLSESVQKDLANNRNGVRVDLLGKKADIVEGLSTPTSPAVPMTNTEQAIDAGIAKLQSLHTSAADSVISQLQDWKTSLANQKLDNVETIRSKVVGKAFQDPTQPQVSELGQSISNQVYGALKKDVNAYVRANAGEDALAQWNQANAGLKAGMDDLKVTALKTALAKGDSSTAAVQNLLFNSDPTVVKTLYKNLSPEGQANARAAILSKVADQSYTSGTDTISPEKFTTAVQKLGGPIGVFFSGDDKAQVDGLVRYLNSTRQASKATANAQTGQQLLAPTALASTGGGLSAIFGGGVGGGIAGAAGTVAGGTALGAISRLYESAPVRDAMIALAKAKPGSVEEGALLKRLGSTLTNGPTSPNQQAASSTTNPLYQQAAAVDPNALTQDQFAEQQGLSQSPATAKRYDTYLRALLAKKGNQS